MKIAFLPFDDLEIDPRLARRSRSRRFVHLLEASIREIGLTEPLKVGKTRDGRMVVIDGILRHEAIGRIRDTDPSYLTMVPVIIYPHDQRFEIRYQTDIYQDLLPSQLAELVEHLHMAEGVTK